MLFSITRQAYSAWPSPRFFFWDRWPETVALAATAYLAIIILTDTIHSKIPNFATLLLALAGLTFNGVAGGVNGLIFSVLGLLMGLGLLLIPYLMGGMGAGDVKALGALGALLGPISIFQVFLYTALIGGVLSLLYYLVQSNLTAKLVAWRLALFDFMVTREKGAFQPLSSDGKARFPYASAIAFGYCAFLHWGAFFGALNSGSG